MMAEQRQDRSALRWIRGELDQTLREARQALEDFVEGQQERMQVCVDRLHHIHGVLDMVQVYGGAMLADEMERLATVLSQGQVTRGEAAAEALMLGMVQLPGYLEKVEHGGADVPLALLPLINDLRAAHDAPLVSETSLFAPKLNAVIAAETVRPGSGNRELPRLMNRQRSAYHRALLSWIRGHEVPAALRQLRDVLDAMNTGAGTARLRRLLDAAEALATALLDDEQAPAPAIKPLFGKLDRVFKRVIDQGEEAAMLDFPVDLLKNFLYYIARSGSQDPAVVAVRKSADLVNSFPQLGADQASFGGPDREMFDAVGEALAQDLRDVKDQLDLYMRGDRSQLTRLTGLAQPIQRIGDTLGMVGRGELRTRLKRRCDELRTVEQSGEVPADERLMALAGDLLLVESSLGSLASAEQPMVDFETPMEGTVSQSLSEAEMQRHVRAAIDEALVELAHVKDAILEYLEPTHERALLAEVPSRLHHVAGVLGMLNLAEGGRLLTELKPFIVDLASGAREVPDAALRDALADVVISAELYMQSAVEPGENRDKLLRVADEALHLLGLRGAAAGSGATARPLGEVVPLRPRDTADEPADEAETAAESEATLAAGEPSGAGLEDAAPATAQADAMPAAGDAGDVVSGVDGGGDAVAEVPAEPVSDVVEAPAEAASEVAGEADSVAPLAVIEDVDPEILEVFSEEADEELAVIQRCFPAWQSNPEDRESLATMRRSFHTLKGSGRIVGALNIGEFAWSIENLLNRVIDGTVAVTAQLLSLLDEAVAVLPVLVAESRQPGAPGSDVSAIAERAFALASGTTAAPSATVQHAEAEAVSAAEAETVEPETIEPESAEPEQVEPGTVEPETVEQPALMLEEIEPPAEAPTAETHFTGEIPEQAEQPVETPLEFEEIADESILTDAEAQDSEFTELDTAAAGAADSSLNAVFVSEAEGHLNVLAGFLQRCREHDDACAFDEGVRRAMHTLRGSARTAGVPAIAELAGALESLSNVMSDSARTTDRAMLGMLDRSHRMLCDLTAAVDEPQREVAGWEALRDEVDGLVDALAHPAAPSLEEQAHAQPEEVAEPVVNPNANVDPELLEVFLEEAKELLEALEGELADWQHAGDGDVSPVAKLQRTLHTMKGGARLAGVVTVGDLSHALESAFESVTEQRVAGSERLKGLVRHATDELAQDIEILLRGELPRPHPAMIERLEAAAHGREWRDIAASEAAIEAERPFASAPATGDALEAAFEAASQFTAAEEPGTAVLEQAAEPPPEQPVEPQEAAAEVTAAVGDELEDEFGVDSELLTDSQLMTDSELLRDSSFLIGGPVLPMEPGAVGAVMHEDSKVIQFPGVDQAVEGEGFVPRRPLPQEEPAPAVGTERVRVASEALDQMVNNAGEVSIYRARIEQQNNSFAFNLGELGQTIDRLRSQLRDLELETEAQILSRHEREGESRADFDPLELDRYSTIQQLSRALSETVEDLSNLGQSLDDLSRDTDTLLLQQSRVTTDLQDALLRTRMVKFSSRVPRLERVVRQTSHSIGKQADLDVIGGEEDMDRAILERMMGPLEHLLRNAVSHGIEDADTRLANGKAAQGLVTLHIAREGGDVVLTMSDDGVGLDRERIRAKAVERGLIEADAVIEDDDLYQLILQPGFSTAQELSQVSGRGVGMDVVLTEVKQLGGSLEIASEPGRGTSFTIRLPYTLAITDALLVTLGDDIYAVPHSSMDGVVRISLDDLKANYSGEQDGFSYAGREYAVRYLGTLLGAQAAHLSDTVRWYPLLLVRSGEHRVAVQVDSLVGNRQIVVKSVGAQLSTVRWFTGGTILADGQIALILDVNALVRAESTQQLAAVPPAAEAEAAKGVSVMVVDDSITVRKVTSRLLERHNMHVITAKDGVDAVTLLQEHHPDVMLLDIEMPRMDGYELARHMRSTPELSDIPIIMITSRTGDKHRNRALELGVRRYLGKPYQEADLLENIYTVLAEGTQ